MTHHLKQTPAHFEEVLSGRKKFEIRFNDRNFKIGDRVELEEFWGEDYFPQCPDRYICFAKKPCPLLRDSCSWYKKERYSGRSIYAKITDIFDISDVIHGYVAFTFEIYNCRGV